MGSYRGSFGRIDHPRSPRNWRRGFSVEKTNLHATVDRVRLRYLTLKLRALIWVLRRLRAGRDRLSRLDRGVVNSRRKTIRAVITRTIIDGSTVDMRQSSSVSDCKLATRLTGKAASWAYAESVVALVAPRSAATKRTSPSERCWTRHFVKTSTKSRPAYDEKMVWDWCKHDGARGNAAEGMRVEYKRGPQRNKQYSGQPWRLPRPGEPNTAIPFSGRKSLLLIRP